MIITHITDKPHGLFQIEVVLTKKDLSEGLSFMDPSRREYTNTCLESPQKHVLLAGVLEVVLAVEEKKNCAIEV